MKPRITAVLMCLHLLVMAVAAQTQRYDIVTYLAPAGWAVGKGANAVTFSDESEGKFCVISLTRSVESAGDSAKNFEMLWKTMAEQGLNAAASPQRGKSGEKDGWQAEVGIGAFEKDGLKGAVLLTTFTGDGKVIAILAITNSEKHEPAIEAFVDGVKLPPITAKVVAAQVHLPLFFRHSGMESRASGRFPHAA